MHNVSPGQAQWVGIPILTFFISSLWYLFFTMNKKVMFFKSYPSFCMYQKKIFGFQAIGMSNVCNYNSTWFQTYVSMMTSSNGNIFQVTGPLWWESTGHRWFSSQRPVTRSFGGSFDLRLNSWAHNRYTDDFRRYRTHYDVTVTFAVNLD